MLKSGALFHFAWISPDGKGIRHVRSAIEDLAFPSRSSRESGRAGRGVCIEHDITKGLRIPTNMGTDGCVDATRNEHAQLRSRRGGR
jgi:hypothetical protein